MVKNQLSYKETLDVLRRILGYSLTNSHYEIITKYDYDFIYDRLVFKRYDESSEKQRNLANEIYKKYYPFFKDKI